MLRALQDREFSVNESLYEFDSIHREVLSASSPSWIFETVLSFFSDGESEFVSEINHPSFYLVDEDFSFSLKTHANDQAKKSISALLEEQINVGSIAWQMKQNRVGVIELKNHPEYRQLITHSILTPEKTFGLFICFVRHQQMTLSSITQNFLSILNNSIASRLESLACLDELKDQNRSLGIQVEVKTKRLEVINETLKSENMRRAKVEEELIDAQVKLTNATEAKFQFLSLVSHELRTPLVPVINLSELLKEKINDADDRALCEMIHTSGTHLLRMMEDMLEISSCHTGVGGKSTSLQRADIELFSFLDESLRFFEEQAQRKNLRFTLTNKIGEDLHILTVPSQLRQILVHLVGNAIKFTDHGHVQVFLERNDNQKIAIKVSDTGIGIEQHNLEKIFEPFVQADAAHSRLYPGAGLGLSICKNLADQMGIDIQVESVFTKGTSFLLIL